MALEPQKQMVAHMGERPEWDVGNLVAETASWRQGARKASARNSHTARGRRSASRGHGLRRPAKADKVLPLLDRYAEIVRKSH
jgi:hypothetical protein